MNKKGSDSTQMNERLKATIEKAKGRFLSPERIFAAIISSFMLAYIVQMFINSDFFDLNSYYNSVSFALFWLVIVAGAAVLCALTYYMKIPSLIPRVLAFVTFVLSAMFTSGYSENGVYFIIGVALVDFVVIMWLVKDDKLELSSIKISHRICLVTACVLFVVMSVAFGYYTSLKYENYVNSTYDFGIFCQMFEQMKTTGLPMTTVERNELLSHFGVHFSPVFYLLLPGYLIFSTPLYLIYSQAFCVALGVFAVYLICKKLGLSGKVTLCFELIYCFYPCLFNGCFYDFHENKFLTVIILFLFYFIISEKTLWTFVFSFLLLSVKEDAAIYLIAIALYVFISRKEKLKGVIMLCMAVCYFIIAGRIISSLGDEGVMMWRLSDYFINGDETFMSVFKSVLYDVGYLIKMMFTADKFPFLIWMLLPVAFLPLMNKQVSVLVLLFPIIPINLMQSWQYQYNIDYQYTYGVAALIIMAALFAVVKMRTRQRWVALLMALFMCGAMFLNVTAPKIENSDSYEVNMGKAADDIDELLSTIPSEASVTAGQCLVPHLYFVDELYTLPSFYGQNKQTDYYILDTRDTEAVTTANTIMNNEYDLVNSSQFVNVYQHR